MPPAATLTPRRAHPTDPPADDPPADPPADLAAALPHLATVLHLIEILLAYGRHLADTLDRRAAAPGFHLIARAFGTSRPAIILAHIRRGLLRAAALEHMLRRRAARGRDLTLPPVRLRTRRAALPAAAADRPAPPAAPPAVRRAPPCPSWRDDWLDGVADPLDPRHLPTAAALQAELCRRPIGRLLGAICADLGIAPVLCSAPFWNALFMAELQHDGSPALYGIRCWRRQICFAEEQDRRPTLDLSWPRVDPGGSRSDILAVLGFLIGEAPIGPPLNLPPPHPSPFPLPYPSIDSPWAHATTAGPAACAGAAPAARPPSAATGPP